MKRLPPKLGTAPATTAGNEPEGNDNMISKVLVAGLALWALSGTAAVAAEAPVQAEQVQVMGHGWQRGTEIPMDVPFTTVNGTFIFQSDGNVVVYDEYGRALWVTGTTFIGRYAALQGDGNFVVYDSFKRPVWASGTDGRGNVMQFQDDGNLVIVNVADRPVWASNTAH